MNESDVSGPGRRRKSGALLFAALLIALSGWWWFQRSSLIVWLHIDEPAGVKRTAEPVTSGVPLPAGKVKDAGSLCLLDGDGKPAPCQFTVLSRWPCSAQGASKGKRDRSVNRADGAIKWVLLDFQTDVAASNQVNYSLCKGGKPAPVRDPVSVRTSDGCVKLETGHLQLAVQTNAAGLIHSVIWNGANIVSSTNPVQVVMTDGSNRVFRASRPTRVTVEAAGPMRATALIEGEFVAGDISGGPAQAGASKIFEGKVGYDLRVTAYAGKPYVKLDFTLKNHGWYGYRNENKPRQWLNFKSLEIHVPVSAAGVSAQAGSEEWNARFADGWTVLKSDRVRLNQWIKYPVRDERGMDDCQAPEETDREQHQRSCYRRRAALYYTVQRPRFPLGDGQKSQGWCELLTGQDRLLGGIVRKFWQNAPKELAMEQGRLIFGLWPEGGFWPRSQKAHDARTYQFEGGREKTTEILLVFGKDGTRTAALAKAFNSPLIAEAAPEWYRKTGAIWPMASASLRTKDAELQEALERYDRLQRAKVHAECGDPAGEMVKGWGDEWGKVSIPSLRERCPDVFYGWMNFGDLVWSHGYCSLFYDWPYLMLIHHLRLHDRAMLDLADEMCRHRYDIDQYHVGNTAEYLGYFQRYEKGEHGHLDRQPPRARNWELNTAPSHTWNRGLLLHWALTGDPRSLRAARENGQAFYRCFFGQHKLGQKEKLVWAEFRSPAWAIDNWLALYEYTGEANYLDWANETFTKTLLAMEKDNGSRGHIIKDGKQSAQFTGYMIEPVCRLHHLTGREDVGEFLKRVLDWQREKGTRGGDTKEGKYQPIVFAENWDLFEEGDLDSGAGVSFDFLFADGYAYLYKVFGRKDDLTYARRLFRDSLFYYSFGLGTETSARSPLGYHYFGEPFGMVSKLHAYSGRYHQLYLQTEEDCGAARTKE